MTDNTVLKSASDLLTTFGVRDFDISKAEDRTLVRSIRKHGFSCPIAIIHAPDGDLVIDGHRRVGAIIYLQANFGGDGVVPCVYGGTKVRASKTYDFS